jgi:hypothetical protein
MSRHLAEDRCAKRGHVLAWVTMQDDQIIVVWNQPEVRNMDANIRRDQRSVVPWGRPAAQRLVRSHAATQRCGLNARKGQSGS